MIKVKVLWLAAALLLILTHFPGYEPLESPQLDDYDPEFVARAQPIAPLKTKLTHARQIRVLTCNSLSQLYKSVGWADNVTADSLEKLIQLQPKQACKLIQLQQTVIVSEQEEIAASDKFHQALVQQGLYEGEFEEWYETATEYDPDTHYFAANKTK